MAKRWYIVHAYSNLEPKVAESIKERARMAGLESAFEEIVVPSSDPVSTFMIPLIAAARCGRNAQTAQKHKQTERTIFIKYLL